MAALTGCDAEDALDPFASLPPPVASPGDRPSAPATAELHVGLEGAIVAQSFEGVTGADVAASARRAECAGWVASAPALVLMLDAPAASVRFRVESRADTTLLIERGDGHLLCNDDAEGLAPALGASLPAGVHRVWVGTWDREDAGAPYTLLVDAEIPEGTPRGEPTVDRLNAVCAENWCASGTAYRFERVECTDACRVALTIDGEPAELVLENVRASWGRDGLDEAFVDALGGAIDALGR